MINRRTWLWVIGTLVVSGLMLGIWGYGARDARYQRAEPTTLNTKTSTTPLYSERQVQKRLKAIKDFEALIKLADNSDAKLPDPTSFAVIPGLSSARTLVTKTGAIGICTMATQQGVTIVGKYMLTSAYDHDHEHNSVIYVQDRQTHRLLNTVVLQGQPHVGGLTYDPQHQRIWVCGREAGRASVFSISLQTLLAYRLRADHPIKYLSQVALGSLSRASFIAYHDQRLYVGLFRPYATGYVESYKLDHRGDLVTKTTTELVDDEVRTFAGSVLHQDILKKVQGIAFYRGYVILSQSYGGGNSHLYIFKFDPQRKIYRASDAVATFTTPSHLEQIATHDGRLYMMVESSAYAYRKRSTNPLDRVFSFHLNDLFQLLGLNKGAKS